MNYNFNLESLINAGIDVDELVKNFTAQVNEEVKKKEAAEKARKEKEEEARKAKEAQFLQDKLSDAAYATSILLDILENYYPKTYAEIEKMVAETSNDKDFNFNITEPTGKTLISLLNLVENFENISCKIPFTSDIKGIPTFFNNDLFNKFFN